MRGTHGVSVPSRMTFSDRTIVPVAAKPHTSPLPEAATELQLEGMWRVVVLNDPVNLMSYVVLVFKKIFGFDEQTARKHMLEVHEQGRSIVWWSYKPMPP